MKGIKRLKGRSFVAEPLAPEDKAEHFLLAETRIEELRRYGRTSRLLGLVVGGAGMLIGVAGLVAVVAIFPLKTIEVRYAVISGQSGEVTEALSAIDAPKRFSDGTARQYLRMLVEACDGYRYQTAKMQAHRCALLLSPEAQQRFSAAFTTRNPESPQNRFGHAGAVTCDNFRFHKYGDGQGGAQLWHVRYKRTELQGGVETLRDWRVSVLFQWRTDLPMSADDRTLNLAGFQALEYTSQAD